MKDGAGAPGVPAGRREYLELGAVGMVRETLMREKHNKDSQTEISWVTVNVSFGCITVGTIEYETAVVLFLAV